MKAVGDRIGSVDPGGRAEQRVAIAGLFLALAAALSAPTLFRTVERISDLPTEVALVLLGSVVALGFFAVGFVLGRHAEPIAQAAPARPPFPSVPHRRVWEDQLAREVSRANRAKMPLSLLLVDCAPPRTAPPNGSARDGALAVLGEVLAKTCRSRDQVARIGREGFAVLLPRTNAQEARIAAERIRSAVANRRRVLGPALAESATVSIGISDLGSLEQPHAQLLLHAADRALHCARNGGRDRVEIGNGRTPTRSSSTVILLDPRRRARKRSSHPR